jgi:hypothetical protein
MADEIWNWLEAGNLANAANLTDNDQLSAIAPCICTVWPYV